ncbi:MAG: hypothetical protein ABI203_03510 [Mucilaginibacter sp.]
MTTNLPYSQLSVNEPEKTYQFLVNHLGFCNNDVPGIIKSLAEKESFFVINRFDNYYLLTTWDKSAEHTEVVVNTDDCLRDYHQLSIAGIKFEKTPGYTMYGLETKFTDEYGNKYKLLEKRDYSEE